MRHESKGQPGGTVGHERHEAGETSAGTESSLSDTQLMTMLEQRRAGTVAHVDEQRVSHVRMLRPEDTGTRQALKAAVSRGDPVSFAVQLLWSPEMIDLNNTPRDPIFRAYTVYTTRVRHDGREWFELRLGFFADAISAKQVAHYMQSEYNSAAVVPVGTEEQAAARAARVAATAAREADSSAGADAKPTADPSQAATRAAAQRPRLTLIGRARGKSV